MVRTDPAVTVHIASFFQHASPLMGPDLDNLPAA